MALYTCLLRAAAGFTRTRLRAFQSVARSSWSAWRAAVRAAYRRSWARRLSCAFRTELLSCPARNAYATPTRTSTQHPYNPSSISSRCESDTAASRFGAAVPPARRGRFRNRGAASSASSFSAGASPPPFRSLSSRRKDIAAPRSAAADDGRPKVSMVYPGLGGGRRGELAFLRGFFAGRRDDGAAGAGASSAASVGGAGVAAPESV